MATVEGTGGRRSFTEQISSLIRDAWNRQQSRHIPWDEVKAFLSTELGLTDDKINIAKVSSRQDNYYNRLNQGGFKEPIALGVLTASKQVQCRFDERILDRFHKKVGRPFEWPLLIIEEDPPGGVGFQPTTLILGPVGADRVSEKIMDLVPGVTCYPHSRAFPPVGSKSVGTDDGAVSSLHLLVKWNRSVNPRTVEDHADIASLDGSVIWGCVSKSGMGRSQERVARLTEQISNGVHTEVILYGTGFGSLPSPVHRSTLQGISTTITELGARKPDYYDDESCVLFLELAEIEEVLVDYLESFTMESNRKPVSDGALANQTTPMYLVGDPDEAISAVSLGTRLDLVVAADCIEDSGIVVDQETVRQMVAAVNAGKHLLLQGPPGVGKTTIAEALARAAEQCDMSRGAVVTTATGDWSSADTVGTYRLDPLDKDRLVFHPGLVLEAIDQLKWIVIDELNRADIDKAIGQLFTVLSGQAVTLPFTSKDDQRISIVPPAIDTPSGTKPYSVSSGWRLIATMNERDRDLLFEMSEALVRRFAVVSIPTPDDDQWVQILKDRLPGYPELDDWLLRLGTRVEAGSPPVRIGPAIVLDCCDYLSERISPAELESPDGRLLMEEALDLFVIPHLSGHTYNANELRGRLHDNLFFGD